jgi:N-methylhydantoinase B/oxoprolinase/acetone carboxylase alpha subunit
MRKNAIVVLAFVLMVAIVIVAGCSKGYETKKAAEDLSVTLKADRYPLIKGDNDLSVNVADASGKTVTDAAVQVRYYMPAMPGMAPMEFNAAALAKGGGYVFTANVPMEGGWKVDVTATRPGRKAVTATFNVDAR